MRQTLSRGVFAAAAAATGILSLYGTPALADSFAGGGAEDSPGVLSGNTVQAPVHVPVNACGNTVTAVGALNSASDNTCVNESGGHGEKAGGHGEKAGGAHAAGGTKGSPGVLSGNTVQAPVHAPVNACGNNVTLGGGLNSASDNTCVNVSEGAHGAKSSSDRSAHSHHASDPGASHSEDGGAHAVGAAKGSPGVLSGNLVQAPIHIPVNACGNNVNLLGLFNEASGNTCVNDSGHHGEKEPEKTPEKDKPEPPVKVKTPPAPVEPPAEHTPDGPPHLAQTGTDGLMAASAAGAVLLTGGAMLYRRGRVGARR
ncbi:chaplin family protein [Streptomyces pseudogriseolus]|uniref:chaplin family protein n=1 Tax=Streptomyces pseudogriseolus TaxID=36817 RepID=UPI00348C21A4